jgi:hypothetical protein
MQYEIGENCIRRSFIICTNGEMRKGMHTEWREIQKKGDH